MSRKIWPSDRLTLDLCKRLRLRAELATEAEDAFGVDVVALQDGDPMPIRWQGKQHRELALLPGIKRSSALLLIVSEARKPGHSQRPTWINHRLQADWLAIWSGDSCALCWSRDSWEVLRAQWLQRCTRGELRPRPGYGDRTGLFIPMEQAEPDLLFINGRLTASDSARLRHRWLFPIPPHAQPEEPVRPSALPPGFGAEEEDTAPLPALHRAKFSQRQSRLTDLQVIEAWDLPYHLGRAVEAIYNCTRYRRSTDPLDALARARECIDRLIRSELAARTGDPEE